MRYNVNMKKNKNTFVISDTWFNRPIGDKASMRVDDYNDEIITKWNKTVGGDDDVYVLGGFGVSDLYSIAVKLNGNIHFLNNFYTDDEIHFRDAFKKNVENSIDKNLSDKLIFEDNQIVSLKDEDVILSYFPLSYWYGKDTGTMCFHGLNDESKLKENNVSCCSLKTDFKPLNVAEVKEKISFFSEVISNNETFNS